MEAQFRIDGVYRQRNGELVRLVNSADKPIAQCLRDRLLYGPRSLIDGSDLNADVVGKECGDRSLLPGELHCVNGEWVPLGVAQEAPKPAAEPTRPRLTWADSKRPDPFDGFIVTSSTTQQDKAGHPLQRMSDPSDQLHGSAFLRD